MEIGIHTFGELVPDPHTHQTISAHERLKNVIRMAMMADEVGLDIFGIGEHLRWLEKGLYGLLIRTISLPDPRFYPIFILLSVRRDMTLFVGITPIGRFAQTPEQAAPLDLPQVARIQAAWGEASLLSTPSSPTGGVLLAQAHTTLAAYQAQAELKAMKTLLRR